MIPKKFWSVLPRRNTLLTALVPLCGVICGVIAYKIYEGITIFPEEQQEDHLETLEPMEKQEKQDLKRNEECNSKVSQMVNNLRENIEDQEHVGCILNQLREMMIQSVDKSQVSQNEERCMALDNIFEFFEDLNGFKSVLIDLISERYVNNNGQIMHLMYDFMSICFKCNHDLRNRFAEVGGIEYLLDTILDQKISTDIRADASLALRKATYIYYYKGDITTGVDFPGIRNVKRIISYDKQLNGSVIHRLLDMTSPEATKLNDGIIGALAHLSYVREGALSLLRYKRCNEYGITRYMIDLLNLFHNRFHFSALCILHHTVSLDIYSEGHHFLKSTIISKALLEYIKPGTKKFIRHVTGIIFCLLYFYLCPHHDNDPTNKQVNRQRTIGNISTKWIADQKLMIIQCIIDSDFSLFEEGLFIRNSEVRHKIFILKKLFKSQFQVYKVDGEEIEDTVSLHEDVLNDDDDIFWYEIDTHYPEVGNQIKRKLRDSITKILLNREDAATNSVQDLAFQKDIHLIPAIWQTPV